jgi:GxxExxY protein
VETNRITEMVIGAAIAVHRELGPGLLESTYESCMAVELAERGLKFARQQPLSTTFKGIKLDCCYRVDMIIEEQIIVELKTVQRVEPVHAAQILSYLRLSGCKVGLLFNFNVHLMKDGIHRFVRGFQDPSARPQRSSEPLR